MLMNPLLAAAAGNDNASEKETVGGRVCGWPGRGAVRRSEAAQGRRALCGRHRPAAHGLRLRAALSACARQDQGDRHRARERRTRRASGVDRRGLEALRMGRPAGPRGTEAPRRQPDVSLAVSGSGAGSRALGRRLRRVRRRRNLCAGRRRRRADRGGLRAVALRHLDRRRDGAAARRACGRIAPTTSASFTSRATRRRRTRPSRARTTSSAIASRSAASLP